MTSKRGVKVPGTFRRPRRARLWWPFDHPNPADWIATAERVEAIAACEEQDPHGRGVDHVALQMHRQHARYCLWKAEQLLGREQDA